MDNSEYEVDIDVIVDDVTDSTAAPSVQQGLVGVLGFAQGLPCLMKLNSLTFSVPEDALASPFLLGFSEGFLFTLFLKRGALESFDLVQNTIFRNSRVTNDQSKARRLTLTFEYGTFTRNVAAPAGF